MVKNNNDKTEWKTSQIDEMQRNLKKISNKKAEQHFKTFDSLTLSRRVTRTTGHSWGQI